MKTDEGESGMTNSWLPGAEDSDTARTLSSASIISELVYMPAAKPDEIEALLQVYDGDDPSVEAFSVRSIGISSRNARRLQLLAERASVRGIAIVAEDLLEIIVTDWFRRVEW